MDLTVRDQIQSALRDYLAGHDSLDQFRDRFVPISIDVEESADPAAIRLAYRIDGILGEASSAGWSEDEIREELATASPPFVEPERVYAIPVQVVYGKPPVLATSANRLASRKVEVEVA